MSDFLEPAEMNRDRHSGRQNWSQAIQKETGTPSNSLASAWATPAKSRAIYARLPELASRAATRRHQVGAGCTCRWSVSSPPTGRVPQLQAKSRRIARPKGRFHPPRRRFATMHAAGLLSALSHQLQLLEMLELFRLISSWTGCASWRRPRIFFWRRFCGQGQVVL